MVDVSIPAGRVEEFVSKFKFVLGTLLSQEMVQKVAVDTSELKQSIRFHTTKEGIEFTMAKHAQYVEYPTAPHVIRAKPGGYLKFPGKNGKDVFAKEVHHPGTDAQPFIRPAFHRITFFTNEAIKITKRDMGIA